MHTPQPAKKLVEGEHLRCVTLSAVLKQGSSRKGMGSSRAVRGREEDHAMSEVPQAQ